MKRAVSILALLILISISVFSGSCLMNDTGETVYGLRIEFSEAVTITGHGETLAAMEPAEKAAEFLFSDGAIEPGGSQWLHWEPSTARIVNWEWLTDRSLLVSGVDADVPELALDYMGEPLPCFTSAPYVSSHTRVRLFESAATVYSSEAFYVAHGWGTLCWESFSGLSAEDIASMVAANGQFILWLDGDLVQPTALFGHISDCSEWSPDYCCGGNDHGDWGWNISWVYEFPADSVEPGVHVLGGEWRWQYGEVRIGPFPEEFEPASIMKLTTLTVLP